MTSSCGRFLHSWYRAPSLRVVNKGLLPHLCKIPIAYKSIVSSVDLAEDIAAVKSADGYLNLYDTFKNSPGMTRVNRVTILHNIAKFATQGSRQNWTSVNKALTDQYSIFEELLESIAAEFGSCNPRDLSTIIWALGKLSKNIDWFVAGCEKEILKRDVNSFSTPAVFRVLTGLASLGLKGSPFFAWVEQRILVGELGLVGCDNPGLAAMLLSFIKTESGSTLLFERFQEEILSRDLKAFSSRHLVQILWCFTVKKMSCDKLFEMIEKAILEQNPINNLSRFTIKMLLWSFAKNGKGSLDFFEGLGAELLSCGIQDFNTGELTTLVWSYAKRFPNLKAMFDLIEEEFNLRDITHFKNGELSVILWSFVKSGNYHAKLFKDCLEEILARDLSLFETSQLSQIAWSFGQAKVQSTELFSRIEKRVMQDITLFSDAELCMTGRGFSQASAGTQKLFKLLEKEILDRQLPANKPDFIPELVWIFSNCSYDATLLFDAAEKELQRQGLSRYKDYQVHNLNTGFLKAGRLKELFVAKGTLDVKDTITVQNN